MAHLVIFPWLDRDEVKNVYEELFSKSVTKQKHAIERITVWKCRSTNRLPSAVESTASFINAQIASKGEELNDTETDLHLRNLYSMALIRFVNHITEKGQQGAYARPVHVVASQVGVPEWIVELRHEATHGSLPSLSELKAATCWALQWLRDKFWEPQISETFAVSALRHAAHDMLKDSLVIFMQRKFQEINGGEAISCKQVLTDIEHVFEQLGSSACTMLLEDGYLAFTEEQLKSLGYSHADLKLDGSFLLPANLIQFWRKIIHLLVKTNLITELVLQMASEITEISSLRNTLLCSWIYTLIWHNKGKKTKKGEPHLFHNYVDIPYKYLIEKCLHLRNLNRSTDALLNLLVDNAVLDIEQKQKLKQFLSVCKTSPMRSEISTIQKTHSVEDFQKEENPSRVPWRKCTKQISWSKYPVGVLPNQVFDYRSLELNKYHSVENLPEQLTVEALDELNFDFVETAGSDCVNVRSAIDKDKELDSSSMFQWDDRVKQTIADQIKLF